MEDNDRVTLFTIVVIFLAILVISLFASGKWYEWNDAYDTWRLEQGMGERGDLILKDGLKFWKPESAVVWENFTGGYNISENIANHSEIIGNIYENPKLLEAEK